MIRILTVSGSLRAGSTNTAVLDTAALVAPEGVEVARFDGLAELPAFNPDDDSDPLPAAVVDLREQLSLTDALLVSTPEYAGALPGSFKNLLDWTIGGSEMDGRPVGWVNVSGSTTGAANAYASLRLVLGYASTRIVEEACITVPISRGMVGEDGTIADPCVRAALAGALRALAGAAPGFRAGRLQPGGPVA